MEVRGVRYSPTGLFAKANADTYTDVTDFYYYFGQREQNISYEQYCPEQRLRYAQIEKALLKYKNLSFSSMPNKRAEFEELRNWFFAEDDFREGSFEDICVSLSISADAIRSFLKKWTNDL